MKKLLLSLALLAFVPPLHAAKITLVGNTINYVYDDIENAGALLLFGTPTIVGDTVRFLPPSFRAESIDGAGTDSVFANFIFESVYAQNGNEIAEIRVLERGDYEITNGDSVSGDLYVQALNNDENALADFSYATDSFDASGDSGGLGIWIMDTHMTVAADFYDPAVDIAVTIQNTLTATTNAFGEHAWIQKKVAFQAGTAPLPPIVPVPAAVWLFGSGLGLLGWMRRKAD